MTSWKTYRLGDVISIKSGFAYKGEYLGKGDKYLLGMGCVSFNEKFLPSGARLYSGDVPSRYFVKAGDIVLATRQQSDNLPILGMPAIIPSTYKNTFVGANLYAVQNDSDIDNNYLYWLLKTSEYIQHIKSCQTGTTVRMITKSNIESFEFKCPNRIERNRISNFLWSLENKIENNRRINDNLEQQAQALYKQWFVDNRSDDWEEKQLSEIALHITDGVHNTVIDSPEGEYYLLSCKNIKSGQLLIGSNERRIDRETFAKLRKRTRLSQGDILVTSVGTVGEMYLVNESPTNYEFQRSVAIIKPNQDIISSYFLYAALLYQRNEIKHLAHGAVQQCIFISDLKEYSFIVPNKNDISAFDEVVAPMFNKIGELQKENEALSTLRDTLLPKLMNGEIKL